MRAGRLRNRIKVYKVAAGRSSTGGILPAVRTHVLTLWGDLTPLSVKDVISAQAAGSEILARCKLRYRTDITSAMEVEHLGQRYQIAGDPLPDAESGREYMTLMLKGKKT